MEKIVTELARSKHNVDSMNRLFNLKNINVFYLNPQSILLNLFLSEETAIIS
jgi:hypothetical protein